MLSTSVFMLDFFFFVVDILTCLALYLLILFIYIYLQYFIVQNESKIRMSQYVKHKIPERQWPAIIYSSLHNRDKLICNCIFSHLECAII